MPDSTQQLTDLITEFLTEDQGEAAPPQVVAALATVGNGQLRRNSGNPLGIGKATVLKQLAAYLVSHYLVGTRPSPTNTYLGQMSAVIKSFFDHQEPPVKITKGGLAALAALALGHMTDFYPPSARFMMATQIAQFYVDGL